MAKGSTFPADDVPDRSDAILAVLTQHAPVPVPSTTLYLAIPDKRALADEFERLVGRGAIERALLRPGDEQYDAAVRLAGFGVEAARAPIAVYRLPSRPGP